MKIAISATGPAMDSDVDPRFGRCQYFIIADIETGNFEAIDNASGMASGGAGIATAQMIAGKGVQVVLTGNSISRVDFLGAGSYVAIDDFRYGRFRSLGVDEDPDEGPDK